MRRTFGRVALIATLALSMVAVVQAPALARWRTMADAALQVHEVCRDGVRLDVGAPQPRDIGEEAPSPLPPTRDAVVQGRIGESGALRLDEQVTLPLRPREITLIDGRRAVIDYFKQFRLRWDIKPRVGRVISFRAAAGDEVPIEVPSGLPPIKRTVRDCRLFG